MRNLNLSKYAPIISSKSVGEEIYNRIQQELKGGESITIELYDIKSMATFCAKQIFGRLYVNLGSQRFFEKIILKGADDDLKTIIQIGIQHALKEEK